MTDEVSPLPNEVQIEVNNNTTAYNHNVAIRITDGRKEVDAETLSKIALERIKEMREIIKNDAN